MLLDNRMGMNFDDRASGIAGPWLWNKLSPELRPSDLSYSQFGQSLKTLFFEQCMGLQRSVNLCLTLLARNVRTWLLILAWDFLRGCHLSRWVWTRLAYYMPCQSIATVSITSTLVRRHWSVSCHMTWSQHYLVLSCLSLRQMVLCCVWLREMWVSRQPIRWRRPSHVC